MEILAFAGAVIVVLATTIWKALGGKDND